MANIIKNSYRHNVVNLLESCNGNVGVELGVAKGIFSLRMMESGYFSYFFGIDAYADLHDVNEYKEVVNKIGLFSNYKLLRMTFDEAYDLFDDESLEVLKFCRELTIDLSKNDDFVLNKQVDFSYDFLSWRKNKYQSLKGGADKVYRLKFYIDNKQKELIERKKNQFKSDNFNLTLRKMTEYSNPKSFIYQVS